MAHAPISIAELLVLCREGLEQCMNINIDVLTEWSTGRLADLNVWASGCGAPQLLLTPLLYVSISEEYVTEEQSVELAYTNSLA